METTVDGANISHTYGERLALDDVSFSLAPGATALVGVNGAGKSTLLQVLAGALKPRSGSVRIMGKSPYVRSERRSALPRVALMPQTASFPSNMTVLEVVSHIGWLRGLKQRDASVRAVRVVEQVGLHDRARDKMKHLSGGMARRVALAQALVSEPDVLLLDEPSTGLDPEQRRIMVRLIMSLEATVLFSSHVIEDVRDVAERVLVLEAGRLLFDDHLQALEKVGAEAAGHVRGSGSVIEAGFLRVVSGRRGDRT